MDLLSVELCQEVIHTLSSNDFVSLRLAGRVSRAVAEQGLTTLTLRGARCCDRHLPRKAAVLALLARMRSLRELTICHGLHRVIRWDELLTSKLTHLTLAYCSAVDRLDAIAACKQLCSLTIMGAHKLTDLAPLANLEHLVSLALSQCCLLQNMSPLSACSSLERLHVIGAPGSPCFASETFPRLHRLRDLHLCGHRIMSTDEPIPLLVPHLTCLQIKSDNKPNKFLFASMSDLVDLRQLHLTGFHSSDQALLPKRLTVEHLSLLCWKHDLRLATACGPHLKSLKLDYGPYWDKIQDPVNAWDTAQLRECVELETLEMEGPFVPDFMVPVAATCSGLTRLSLPILDAPNLRAALRTVAGASFAINSLRSLEVRGSRSDKPTLDRELMGILASLPLLHHLCVDACHVIQFPEWPTGLTHLSLHHCHLPDILGKVVDYGYKSTVAEVFPKLVSLSLADSVDINCFQLQSLTKVTTLKSLDLANCEISGKGLVTLIKNDGLRRLLA